jgi:beta-N-acetylhexosaminidase
MTIRERVGQLLMLGVNSGGLTQSDVKVLAETRPGSVLLLGNSTVGAARIEDVTRQVRRANEAPDGVRILIAADQEGGLVQRLRGKGFEPIPSAIRQAQLSDRELTAEAQIWGRQLKRAGVTANLAPVADVVPPAMTDLNEPIGQLRRGYGSDPASVAAKVSAFVSGMHAAGVSTAVKHFPGLGRVRGNTDFRSDVTDWITTRNDPALAGFRSGVRVGTDMIMVSSATYTKIDSRRRATFSRTVLREMIRRDLQFTGVIISDDLAAAAMQDLSPKERVIRFLTAGGDLAILGDPDIAKTAADGVVARARQDEDFARLVAASALRVIELKRRNGLAGC